MAISEEEPRRRDFLALSGPLCGGAVLARVPARRRRSRLRVPPSSIDVAVHCYFSAGSGEWSGVTLLVSPPEGAASADASARRKPAPRLKATGAARREN